MRVRQVGVGRLSQEGRVYQADHNVQHSIKEDVRPGRAGQAASGVEGQRSDQEEQQGPGAEVEGSSLDPLNGKKRRRKDRLAVKGYPYWKGDPHDGASVYQCQQHPFPWPAVVVRRVTRPEALLLDIRRSPDAGGVSISTD